jgi:hypothetical protein
LNRSFCTQVTVEHVNKFNTNLQPFEKFCDGQSVDAEQINSLGRVHDGIKKIIGSSRPHATSLRKNQNRISGAMVLFAGDFHQALPIVLPRSTPAHELDACLKSSILWKDVRMLKLNMNMRV